MAGVGNFTGTLKSNRFLETSMSAFSKYWVACAIAALAGAFWMGTPAPAHAQISIGFGGMPFRFHIGPGYRDRHHGRKRRAGERDRGNRSAFEGEVRQGSGFARCAIERAAKRRLEVD